MVCVCGCSVCSDAGFQLVVVGEFCLVVFVCCVVTVWVVYFVVLVCEVCFVLCGGYLLLFVGLRGLGLLVMVILWLFSV